ncbi:MAG: FtsX-like permease family protein [Pseudomonadota bacterium]
MTALFDIWRTLPGGWQDAGLLLLLLSPLVATGLVVLRGYSLWPLLVGLLRKHAVVAGVFVGLIAASVALGASVIAQERALREATARSAEKFDMIIAAPGNEITAMLATVYLEPTALPLLDGETYAAVANHEFVSFAAPLAFGDSYQGAPVVGTTPGFVEHLSGGLSEGRVFSSIEEAVIGARVDLEIGAVFEPVHGTGALGVLDEHGAELTVVGVMPLTGSPWDNAILVPVEQVWDVHALPNGHPAGWNGSVGPPFDPASFPGTPAILVTPTSLWAGYNLRGEFTSSETMAFFPGTVLAELHAIMGDIRAVIAALTAIYQGLIVVSVLAGLTLLTRILSRRLSLLKAVGAPQRFVFAVTWSFATLLILAGGFIGLAFAAATTGVISGLITERTQVLVTARLGWEEIHLVAAFLSAAALLSLLPAWQALRRPVVEGLRS